MGNTNLSQANTARFKFYLMLALCPVFLVGLRLGTAETQKAFLDAKTIYDGWEANYGDIKSMKFRLSEAQAISDGSGIQTYSQWSHWEKIVDGKRVYVRTSNSEKGFTDVNSVVVTSFDGRVGKMYKPKLKQGSIYKGLKGAIPEFRNPMKGCLSAGTVHVSGISSTLGKDDPQRKLVEGLMEKFPEGIPVFTFHFMTGRQSGQVRVLLNLESVAGQICHVVEIGDSRNGPFTRYWVAHEKGMLPLRYVTQYAPGDYAKMEVIKIASVETDLGQVWYPSLVTRERKRGGGIRRHEVRVHEFIPHIKVPSETFDIDFPGGTRIADQIANVSYIAGGDPRILAPNLDDDISTQAADAAETGDMGEDSELQTHENLNEAHPNDVNSATVSRKVLGDADNSSILTLSLLIGAALAGALVLWFCIGNKKPIGKETKP